MITVICMCKGGILVCGLWSTYESIGDSDYEPECPRHPLIGRSSRKGTKPPDGLLLMTPARSCILSSLYASVMWDLESPRYNIKPHLCSHCIFQSRRDCRTSNLTFVAIVLSNLAVIVEREFSRLFPRVNMIGCGIEAPND